MRSPLLAPVVIKLTVNSVERLFLDHQAELAGLTTLDYIRTMTGLSTRSKGRPTHDQVADLEDAAHALLLRINLDPDQFFLKAAFLAPVVAAAALPPDESTEEREVRLAKLRKLVAGIDGKTG